MKRNQKSNCLGLLLALTLSLLSFTACSGGGGAGGGGSDYGGGSSDDGGGGGGGGGGGPTPHYGISVGTLHTCAIKASAVYCWGFNSDGQLGDDSTITRNTPVALAAPLNAGVTSISAGGEHTCAIRAEERRGGGEYNRRRPRDG